MVSRVALRTWHIVWLRNVTLSSLLENCKTIQQNTTFYIFLPRWRKLRLSIGSCSKLVGCQSERKLRGVHWKMGRWTKELRSTQRHAWMRSNRDLWVIWLWLWNVCRIDCFVNGMLCVSYLLIIPSKRFILLENVELDFPAKLYRG